jgi:hypothetical protein
MAGGPNGDSWWNGFLEDQPTSARSIPEGIMEKSPRRGIMAKGKNGNSWKDKKKTAHKRSSLIYIEGIYL